MVKVGTVWVCLLTACAVGCGVAAQDTDPLPSWNDSTSKKAIVDFVSKVTQEGGADFGPVSERIATFDNDGTLWAEQPVYGSGSSFITPTASANGHTTGSPISARWFVRSAKHPDEAGRWSICDGTRK